MSYVGLDVSSARVAVCVVDDEGAVALQRSAGSTPGGMAETLAPFGAEIERIGLEAGPTSPWLARGLRALGLPATVIGATPAAAALRKGFATRPIATTRVASPTSCA